MSSTLLHRASAAAATLVLGLLAWSPETAGGPLSLSAGQVRYAPVQAIHYEIGSKAVSGYFVTKAATCLLTLLVIEKSDPETPTAQSAARLRFMLFPGQVAGLDSEEGRSLNFACEEHATTLLVDIGDRDIMVEQQAMLHQKLIIESQKAVDTTVAAGAD